MSKYEAGTVTVFGDDFRGGENTVATFQCVHCGGHWIAEPGSKRTRGYCQNCAGFVCGPACEACVPVEQLLENYEKGLPEEFRPTRIAVPSNLPDFSFQNVHIASM